MKPLYVSVEQELVLRDHPLLATWAENEKPTDDQYHHHYIVVSNTSYGNEEPGWVPTLIGPFSERRTDKAMEEVVNMLKALGHTVYTPDDAPGEWVMGGLYAPGENG